MLLILRVYVLLEIDAFISKGVSMARLTSSLECSTIPTYSTYSNNLFLTNSRRRVCESLSLPI